MSDFIAEVSSRQSDTSRTAGTGQFSQPAPVGRQVARGTMWSVGGRLISMLTSVVTIPVVTRILGAEQYGAWTLANTLNAYLAFTDLGTGTASTKFGADAYAREDKDREAAVIWTSLLITLIPASLGILTVVLAAGSLVESFFQVPPDLQRETALAFRLTALGFGGRIFAGVFNTPLLARLRIDLCAGLNAGVLLIQGCATVLVLVAGGGLRAAVLVMSICSLLTAPLYAITAWALLPSLLRPRIDWKLAGPLLRFGSGVMVSSVVGLVLINAEKLLLAHFATVRELAYYSVAANLATVLAMVPSALNQPLLPALSALHASKRDRDLQRLCEQALQGVFLWLVPVSVLIVTAAAPFLSAWAGPEYSARSTLPFYILVLGVACNIMAYVPHNLLTALGHTGMIARCHLLELVPYILCAILLTSRWGAMGAAVAWSLRMFFDALLLFALARRKAGLSLQVLRGGWGIYAALIPLAGSAVAAFWVSSGLPLRIIIGGIGVMGYFAIVWTGVLTTTERASLRQLFSPHWVTRQ